MRFAYKPAPVRAPDPVTGRLVKERPIIPLGLVAPSGSLTRIPYEALVDSGADWCLFHAEVGWLLGINVAKGAAQRLQGVGGGECKAYLHPIEILVGNLRASIVAGFVEGLAFPFGLLGQAGFFDRFVVTLSGGPPQPYVEVLTRQ